MIDADSPHSSEEQQMLQVLHALWGCSPRTLIKTSRFLLGISEILSADQEDLIAGTSEKGTA